jgi:hypothetical protein
MMLVAERNRFREALHEENWSVHTLTALSDALVSRNRRLRKTLEEIAVLIRAQKAGEALPLIAVVLDHDRYDG